MLASSVAGLEMVPPPDGGGGGGEELAAEDEELALGGGGEDRLSALPDDILLSVLLRLRSTAAAARTSVLSRRWRGLWAQLPEIRFPFPSDPAGVGPALAAAVLDLRLLHVGCRDDAGAEAWLRVAARRLAWGGQLYFHNRTPGEEKKLEEAALFWKCPTFELPCFETAARVWLRLGFVDLTLAPTGVFAGLTELRLENVSLECGEHELSSMVSSPRCPALRKLRLASVRGLVLLSIVSQTLERLELHMLRGLEDLTVEAPMLRALNVHACFAWSKPIAAIYAPALELLWWNDSFDASSVQFENLQCLQELTTFTIPVYGRLNHPLLQDYVMLLQYFMAVTCLDLKLNYEDDLIKYKYLMENITKLPKIKNLSLWLDTKGHTIGPSVFHLLRTSPGIRKLKVTLLDDLKVDIPCAWFCPCKHEPSCVTSYTLDVLEEVEIHNFRGWVHDFSFVELLLGMSPAIKKMTITFHHLTRPSEAKCEELCSLCSPGIYLKIHRNVSEASYEPTSSLFPKTPDNNW